MDTRALLDTLADGHTHSGAALARRLGVSRAAVWKQIETLRAAGLPVLAEGGRGYRVERPLQMLDAGAIGAALPRAVRALWPCIEVRWQLDSTSSELLRAAEDLPGATALFAEWQTAGRGRRGRGWLAPPLLGLTFSLLWRFEHGYAALAGLSLAIGVAVAETLRALGARDVALKWPNDVQHGGRKLAGILVELGGEFLGPCHAVIGIGLNLHLPRSMREAAGQPVADLAEACGDAMPARNALAAALLAALGEALEQFAHGGFAAFAARYAALDALAGREVTVEAGERRYRARAAGVDARGALRVRRGDGVVVLDSADVSVRA